MPTYLHTYIHRFAYKHKRTYSHPYITYVYIRIYIYTYERTCLHIYIRTYIGSHISTNAHTPIRTLHTYTYVHTYIRKAEIFNQYFANQCKINDNGIFLPPFSPKTNVSLSRVFINKDQIIRIINNFNSNKAHGCDGISVSMLKLCAAEVATPPSSSLFLRSVFN